MENLFKTEFKLFTLHVELTCAGWRPAPALASVDRVCGKSSLEARRLSDNSLANLLLNSPPSPFPPHRLIYSPLLQGPSGFLSPFLDRSWHQPGRFWTHPVCRTCHQRPTIPERPLRWTVVLCDRWAPRQHVSGERDIWLHEPSALGAVCDEGTLGVQQSLRTASLCKG